MTHRATVLNGLGIIRRWNGSHWITKDHDVFVIEIWRFGNKRVLIHLHGRMTIRACHRLRITNAVFEFALNRCIERLASRFCLCEGIDECLVQWFGDGVGEHWEPQWFGCVVDFFLDSRLVGGTFVERGIGRTLLHCWMTRGSGALNRLWSLEFLHGQDWRHPTPW